VAAEIAGRMQGALGWTQDRTQQEIESLTAFYDVV
jgi:hypothetical protein